MKYFPSKSEVANNVLPCKRMNDSYFLGVTVAIASGLYWFFSCVNTQITPLIIGSSLKLHGYFYIISTINCFAFFFVLFTLPETKVTYRHNHLLAFNDISIQGVSLEKIDILFSQSVWERFVGTFR